jgi:hypothetical protein
MKLQNIAVILSILFTLSGCSTMRDRPTLERMDLWFKKVKYVETFESSKSPEELLSAARKSGCQNWNTTNTGTAVLGPTAYAPVSVTVSFSVDSGVFGPGGVWAGLKSDAIANHDVVMAFKAYPFNGGSKVEVAPVKKGLVKDLRRDVEDGKLFCSWLYYSNPWRL